MQLSAVITDADSDSLAYAWTSSGGGSFDDAAAADTTWTAPDATAAAQTITLTLTVTDAVGGTTFTTDVTVQPNQPPAVSATADRSQCGRRRVRWPWTGRPPILRATA